MTTKIGRFEIAGELGRGAQSVVYLARDPQLEREIAIKTMHFARPDPTQNASLLAEARMVSRLSHANIVPIFEAGEEGGDLYLVFEYVRGQTLSQVIRDQGALKPMRAATLMRQVLDAIAAAHAAGIIHRDLKPSNILVDESGVARVMDFGIATRVSGKAGDEAGFAGTPGYMAPEYIERREISEKTDVFAAGLIFYELLFGRPAAGGADIYQVMNHLANRDIEIPRVGVNAPDDRLADILLKALARKPEQRYDNAATFLRAVDEYLDPSGEVRASGADAKQSTMEFLLRRMRHRADFPALSQSVSSINRIAVSEKDGVNKLSATILHDFSLTNKLLKLVNSAYFRSSGAGNISTVSRAIMVLGFDAVRNLAVTVVLYEHMQKSPGVSQLMEEFLKANLSGLIARDLGHRVGAHDGEQVFICALFHGLGRMLSQYYFPDESETVRRLMQQKEIGEDAAAILVLGLSYEELGVGIATSWGFPPLIIASMRRLPPGPLRKSASAEDRLRLVSGLANELCDLVVNGGAEDRAAAMKQIRSRFAENVRLDAAALDETLARSFAEVEQFANVVHLSMPTTELGRRIRSWSRHPAAASAAADARTLLTAEAEAIGDTALGQSVVAAASPGQSEVSGSGEMISVDAQSILAAGIQDISNTLVEEFKLNDVLRIILETMYRAMGFQRVILCIRDGKTGFMQGRFGFGPDANEVFPHFRFSLNGEPDVFLGAIAKGVDVLIRNIDDDNIRARIPAWSRKFVPAKSFVLFPLKLKGNPVALIYGDGANAGDIVISEKELALLRTLRNQAILAIKNTM
jgi:serine/threonine protein kinase